MAYDRQTSNMCMLPYGNCILYVYRLKKLRCTQEIMVNFHLYIVVIYLAGEFH